MSFSLKDWSQSDRQRALFYGFSAVAVGVCGAFCAYRLNDIRNQRNLINFYKNNRRMINVGIKDNKVPSLRIMSFNILADGHRYALSDRFNYCPLKYRKWNYRFKRLIAEIEAYQPDIIGLQETTYKTYHNSLQFALDSIGYGSVHIIRDEAAHKNGFDSQTDCIVFNKHKFDLINHKIVRFDRECEKEKYEKYFGETGSDFRSKSLKKCPDILVVLHLKMKHFEHTPYEFIACSTHLLWNPKQPHIKLSQALMINTALEELVVSEWKLDLQQIPMVICGDFNALHIKTSPDRYDPYLTEGEEMKSGVYQLMTEQLVDSGHYDHPKRRIYEKIYRSIYYQMNDISKSENEEETEEEAIERIKGINIDELAENVVDSEEYPQLLQLKFIEGMSDFESNIRWKSAYCTSGNEPVWTNHVPHFSATIDYIFCNDQFRVLSYLEHPVQRGLSHHIPNLDAMQNGMDDSAKNSLEKMEKEKEVDEGKQFPFLPNAQYISDHLPLVTDLQFMPNEEEKGKIIERLES